MLPEVVREENEVLDSAEEPLTEEGRAAAATNRQYYDVSFDWVGNQPVRTGLVKAYPYARKVVDGMDWLGGKVANALGLTSSRFQYAVDEYWRREKKKHRKDMLERQLQEERERAARSALDDDDDVPYAPPVVTQEIIVQ